MCSVIRDFDSQKNDEGGNEEFRTCQLPIVCGAICVVCCALSTKRKMDEVGKISHYLGWAGQLATGLSFWKFAGV